jgi:hypothetical protein
MEILVPAGCLALRFAFFHLRTPSFHDRYFGVAKNETTAVESLHKIYELESAYATAHPDNGLACRLIQLRGDSHMPDGYANFLNLRTGEWVGFKYDTQLQSGWNDGGQKIVTISTEKTDGLF